MQQPTIHYNRSTCQTLHPQFKLKDSPDEYTERSGKQENITRLFTLRHSLRSKFRKPKVETTPVRPSVDQDQRLNRLANSDEVRVAVLDKSLSIGMPLAENRRSESRTSLSGVINLSPCFPHLLSDWAEFLYKVFVLHTILLSGSGTDSHLSCASVKLHLCVYCDTVRTSESKERLLMSVYSVTEYGSL